MLPDLPSLHGFQPDFYVGGPERFHLPLAYDLIAVGKPRLVVTVGFGDGELHFAFCQAAREHNRDVRIVTTRVQEDGPAADDETWQRGRAYGEEFYGELSVFVDGPGEDAALRGDAAKVDLLVLNDCASYESAREQFERWVPRLSEAAVVLVHGISTIRKSGVPQFWREIRRGDHIEFSAGVGLGIMAINPTSDAGGGPLVLPRELQRASVQLPRLYELAASRIDSAARAARLENENRALELRQIWIPSLLDERVSMQATIDHLNRHIEHITRVHEWNAGQARAMQNSLEAQLVEAGKAAEELQVTRAERDELRIRLAELKRLVKATKAACRRGGRCFQVSSPEPKKPVPLGSKVLREIRRLGRQVGLGGQQAHSTHVRNNSVEPHSTAPVTDASERALTRYETWIVEHEPSKAELELQRSSAAGGPLISLLVPVHDTPAEFLDEMISSVVAQTYASWELCIVNAGCGEEATAVLSKWAATEPRVRVQRIQRNLGIAENTNRSLANASGEFIALLDHDDLLAPFALFEVARALRAVPQADVLYTDEDRWTENGRRAAPFFKPEWSPELLYSCMYIGHLTVYRRALVNEIDGLRKEFDLSQDYDLALRATERAREVIHIPRVLYHWREHAASGSAGGKPHARATNLAALDDALRRRGFDAEVIEYPTANRVRIKLQQPRGVSLIIPTDSPERATACANELPRATRYADYEIVIVANSQLVADIESRSDRDAHVRCVRYDKPFNFSDKCNEGAEASTGDTLIFLNDDVTPEQGDWVENLIEPLENSAVGAVAPKMVYANGKIQHAGLVTGVRNLIGTAFHLLPKDSTEHVNFAQSMRNVSALSGACFAIRRTNFLSVGRFDAERLPIFHSDVDLCFKLRDAGLRCVYTPFATMRHIGHVSLGELEKSTPRAVDKSDIYLLKRWAGYTAHDPYFPENMREWLYRDSPTPIWLYGRNDPSPAETDRDVIVVAAGLERVADARLYQLIAAAKSAGNFVVVMAARDGEMRDDLSAANIPVIIDSLVLNDDGSFAKFCRNFDMVAITTAECEPAARVARSQGVPVDNWFSDDREQPATGALVTAGAQGR